MLNFHSLFIVQFAGGIIGKGGQNIKRLRQEVRKSAPNDFAHFINEKSLTSQVLH